GGADHDRQLVFGFVIGRGLCGRRHGERCDGAGKSAQQCTDFHVVSCVVFQKPRWRGSHRASSGKVMSSSSTAKTATSSHVTQRKVLSMGTSAMRHDTMRLTARGGVNCPSATMTVSSTPNQTGSQP